MPHKGPHQEGPFEKPRNPTGDHWKNTEMPKGTILKTQKSHRRPFEKPRNPAGEQRKNRKSGFPDGACHEKSNFKKLDPAKKSDFAVFEKQWQKLKRLCNPNGRTSKFFALVVCKKKLRWGEGPPDPPSLKGRKPGWGELGELG